MQPEFKPWGKTPRLNRDMVITEKIDGTNACVIVHEDSAGYLTVSAQSRNRLIHPDADNHGFARWVYVNQEALVKTLGEGYHYGEWWGQGIARKYGLDEKRFSLFNVKRWGSVDLSIIPGLGIVPILYEGPFDTINVADTVLSLRMNGSTAAPGFEKPEGVIVYHEHARQLFKVTLENDEIPKGWVEHVGKL